MKSPDIISAVKPVVEAFDKLDWYRLGGGVSERQWSDVLGVLKVQKNLLDIKYLRHWASELGLVDLLERALSDAETDWEMNQTF